MTTVLASKKLSTTFLPLQIANCGGLTGPDNGEVDVSSTIEDGIANYSCDEGFVLLGVSARVCQANAIWSDEAPICAGKEDFTLVPSISSALTFTSYI